MVLIFKNGGERSSAKNYCPASLLSVVNKVFEKLVNNKPVDYLGKCGLFLIFCQVSDLLNQLQFFWQLYLIELLGLLIHLRTTWAVALDISKAFNSFCPGLLCKLNSYGIWGLKLALFCLFLVIDSLRWF